jgi:hypothetical protein
MTIQFHFDLVKKKEFIQKRGEIGIDLSRLIQYLNLFNATLKMILSNSYLKYTDRTNNLYNY